MWDKGKCLSYNRPGGFPNKTSRYYSIRLALTWGPKAEVNDGSRQGILWRHQCKTRKKNRTATASIEMIP